MGRARPYCSQGITVRSLRLAICEELNTNPHLRQAIETAAGGGVFQVFDTALMKGQGKDLRMIGCAASGQMATLLVDVQIGSPKADGTIDDECVPSVPPNRTGSTRRVTLAPAAWFHHSGNARRSENPLSFESLMLVVSPSLHDVLCEGVERVIRTYDEIKRPKRAVPTWVWTKRW